MPDPLQLPHIEAFDLLCKQRLDALQLDKLLIYLINSVDAKALYYLAEQFDLLGYKGWKLADTDAKKRALIKNAIELHRYKGTIYAIRKALAALGYPNVTITEHVTHWATFKLSLNIGNNTLTPSAIADIEAVVNEYKNVRSHFWGIQFQVVFDDSLSVTDDSDEGYADLDTDSIFVGGDFRYDGTYYYDGTKNYSSDTDVLTLQIIP
ncbi:MAG: phage tail protein I [Bacteroidetes bacterium]|nr:phage tail protein I [Bacteroidota bacterium]